MEDVYYSHLIYNNFFTYSLSAWEQRWCVMVV